MTSSSSPDVTRSPTIDALYREHHGWLYRWLVSKLGQSDVAADLAHDTYVRILASDNLPPPGNERAFLLRSAKSLVVDRYRRIRIETAYTSALAALSEDHHPSEETRAIIVQTLFAIEKALDTLPANVKRAFLLSQVEELTYAEIAAQLGVSTSMVRQYMARALQACYHVIYA